MIARSIFILFLLLTLFTAGCGYRLVGTGNSQIPPHIKTLAIPVFENRSEEPTIQRNLTNVVRRAFINDGRLKLVTDKRADLLMKGILTRYFIRAVAFDRNDVATEYWVYLNMEVEVHDRKKDEIYLKQSLNTRWDYRPDSDVVNAEAARQEAFNQAYRVLSQRLVSLVIDKF